MLLITAALAISLPPVRTQFALLCGNHTNRTQVFGKELIWRRVDDDTDYEDHEREPLLEHE